jgi:hypothetical protein
MNSIVHIGDSDGLYEEQLADQKVNGFGPAHIEVSDFKGIFGCIFR